MAAETDRATKKENGIISSLSTETEERIDGDNTLSAAIAKEVSDRKQAITSLSESLTASTTSSISSLNTKIDAETDRATKKETELDTAIKEETSRATEVETTLENEFIDGTKKVKSAETADKANSVAWVDVTDKPTNFITSDNIGSQTVSKANQDGSGNVITSTYATKSELDGKAGKYDVDQPWHDLYHADPIGWTKIADLGGSSSCGVVEILAITDWNYATLYHGYFSFSCFGVKGSYKYSLVSDPKAFGFQGGYISEDGFGVKVTVDKDGGVWIGLMRVLFSCVPKFRYIIFPATRYESDFTTSDTAPMPDNCIILDNGALEVTNGVPKGNGLIPNYMRNINLIDGKNNGKDIATKDDIPSSLPDVYGLHIGSKYFNGSASTTIYASDLNAPTKDEVNSAFAKKTDIPTSLPASDVSAWAKASSKPSYSWSEISNKPTIPTKVSQLENDKEYVNNAGVMNRYYIGIPNKGAATYRYFRIAHLHFTGTAGETAVVNVTINHGWNWVESQHSSYRIEIHSEYSTPGNGTNMGVLITRMQTTGGNYDCNFYVVWTASTICDLYVDISKDVNQWHSATAMVFGNLYSDSNTLVVGVDSIPTAGSDGYPYVSGALTASNLATKAEIDTELESYASVSSVEALQNKIKELESTISSLSSQVASVDIVYKDLGEL